MSGAATEKKISDYVVDDFCKKYNVHFRLPANSVRLSDEEIASAMRNFHIRCDALGKLFPDAVHETTIVQFDETQSLNGEMRKSSTKLVASVGQAPGKTTVTPASCLSDHRKIATVVCFVSTVKIPPLFIFKGKGHVAAEENFYFTDGSNMTSELFELALLPHIKRHHPAAKILVFDGATSHKSERCEKAINEAGMFALQIPEHLTQFVQLCDVYLFRRMREIHRRIVDALRYEHDHLFAKMTSGQKRYGSLRKKGI